MIGLADIGYAVPSNGWLDYYTVGSDSPTHSINLGYTGNGLANTGSGDSFFSGMFGKDGWLGSNAMDVLGTLGSIGSGLANYFNSQKMLGLAQDQFDFQKALANRNLENQAKIINNQYDSSAQVAAAMAGRGGSTSGSTINRYEDNAKKKHVNSSYIG